jgi:PTS system mannose-specific IID component
LSPQGYHDGEKVFTKKNKELCNVYIRSLSIHSSQNFWRMQNLGFAFSIAPVLKKLAENKEQASKMLERHLQLFSTNPYMSGPIMGSVIRLEEDLNSGGDCPEADQLKKTLMAPYAAMGDSLFWGSLKPFASAMAVLTALKGFLLAPLVLLLIFNPVPFWVRIRGFFEGYRRGKDGIEFLKIVNLPQMSMRLRWMSTVLMGILAFSVSTLNLLPLKFQIVEKITALVLILLCYWMLKQGISSFRILYGAFVLFIFAASI